MKNEKKLASDLRICGECDFIVNSSNPALNVRKVFRCNIDDNPLRPGQRVGLKAKCFLGLKKISDMTK